MTTNGGSKLASAGHRVAVDDERRQHLGISLLLAVEVEHVLDERALELRALAENHGEARARELHAAREVEDAELFADLDVRRDLEVGILPLADHPDDLVRRAVGAGRDLGRGDVRDHQKRLAEIVVDLRELLVDLGYAVADLAHLVLRGRDVSAGSRDLADLLRGGIALRLQRLGLGDERAALRVEVPRLLQFLYLDSAAAKLGRSRVEFIPQLLDVDHFFVPSAASRRFRRKLYHIS